LAEKRGVIRPNSGHFLDILDIFETFFEAQKMALSLDFMGANAPFFGPSGKHPESVVYLDDIGVISGRECW
jgi:hypothetical protein